MVGAARGASSAHPGLGERGWAWRFTSMKREDMAERGQSADRGVGTAGWASRGRERLSSGIASKVFRKRLLFMGSTTVQRQGTW